MKKLLLLILLIPVPILALEKYASHSFMYTRPSTHNLAAEEFLWHYYMRTKTGPIQSCLQVMPFYNSTGDIDCETDDKAAIYFLPLCKPQLTVVGDGVVTIVPRDVRAEWLGINNPLFSGKLSLAPRLKQYGAVVEWNQNLSAFTDIGFFQPFWVSIMLPFTVEKKDPGLRQTDVLNASTVGGGPNNILQAFNQTQWRFSHINGEHRKSGLAECKLKLGATFATRRDAEVILYSLLSFPTASRQCATLLFAPYLGNNAHYTYGTGVSFQIPFSSEFDEKQVFLFAELEHMYMFGNTQFRTFDLKQKPWSRFLLFNSSDGLQVNVPGVNILTRRVHVRPDSFVDLVTGFRARWNNMLEAEIGYNFWAHGNERIELKRTFCDHCDEEIDLGLFGIAGTGGGQSASSSTIANQAANDPAFIPLNITNIDLESGAAGAACTHKIHGALGYGYSGEKIAGFIGFGGFFEAAQNDAALQQWGLWGKIGASF